MCVGLSVGWMIGAERMSEGGGSEVRGGGRRWGGDSQCVTRHGVLVRWGGSGPLNKGSSRPRELLASFLAMVTAGSFPAALSPHPSILSSPFPPGKKARGPSTKGVAAQGVAGNVVLWLRQDLRVHDNPALCEAAKTAAAQVCGVFCGGGK